MNGTIHDILNRQIASWQVLYVKLHNYHWYIKGPQFFTLHAKFEELYDEAAEHIDNLAERLLAIGGAPAGTMKECLELSIVKEAAGGESEGQMVANIADDFDAMIRDLASGVKQAQSEGDEPTADMLLGIQSGLEKHVWMLRAFLK